MMKLIEYSAINTKIKAMRSRLLTLGDYRKLAESGSVMEAVSKLQSYQDYSELFKDINESNLHRSYIEKLLLRSKFTDFGKLYKFANLKQRKFLNLYFISYEIELLKRCLRNCLFGKALDIDLSEHKAFFDRHSKVDFENLIRADSVAEFLESIRASIYYEPLEALYKNGDAVIFDYELCIDLLYFKTVWKIKDRLVSKINRRLMEAFFGTRLDLLNLQWIYRSKKYYSLSQAQLYSMLIPDYYKLKESEIKRLTSAQNLDEFLKLFTATYYGRLQQLFNRELDIESFSEEVMHRINLTSIRKNPYSIALLNSYLFEKEREIAHIINVIEAVRFGYSADRIMTEILKKNNTGRRSTA